MNTKNSALTLGDFIKNHRMGENYSQIEFANFLGISRQRLCDIEKNRASLSIKLCKKFAKKLDLPPEWLVRLALRGQIEKEGLNLKIA